MTMTNYIYNSKEYLKKRLAGEDVNSAVALFGINAMATHDVSGNFTVLAINMNDYSFFRYDVAQDGYRFGVLLDGQNQLDFEESEPHSLTNVVSPAMLQNKAMLKWWNCVFFERNGKRSYDSFYDGFHIANDTDVTFKDVIKGFESVLSKLPLYKLGNRVFLTGDLAENPLLQYVLQNRLSKEISVLRCNETASYSESDRVILPEKLERLKLTTNITMDLASMVNKPINITLPLDSSTLESMMLQNIKWGDICIDRRKNYSINGLDFKTVKLHVECDVFQNIFLYCMDMNGNPPKVIQVN